MDRPCRIMLVDDDEDDQLIFKSVVSEINTHIDCKCYVDAIHGMRTLQADNSEKPDCIFLDLNLPFMHGFEFLETIKTSTEFNSIPVIIYSTSSRDSDKIKAKQLGAMEFLSKPTSYKELKDKLTKLLPTCLPMS